MASRLLMAGVSGAYTSAAAYLLHKLKYVNMPIETGSGRDEYLDYFIVGASGSLLAQFTLPILMRV